jgi:hypothetical protein
VRLPFTFLQVELIFTIITTILYIIAFIVILSGFGWCAGNSECDARIAAGVSKTFFWNLQRHLCSDGCIWSMAIYVQG